MTRWNYYAGSRRNKYKNKKTEVDGIIFDSIKEARRWQELRLAEKAGAIGDLKRQVRYQLIPAQREPDTRGPRGGIIKGKLLERAVYYIADFVYLDISTGQIVAEDTKGFKTKEYTIKRKLMLYMHNIKIREV